jgi:adenylosuccinate synthase
MLERLSVVYGGHWGSEGKGQVLAAMVRDRINENCLNDGPVVIRVGGPNAGHTVRGANGDFVKVQSIPSPAFAYECSPVIGAGGLVNLDVLLRELKIAKVQAAYGGWDPTQRPLLIDGNAMVVTHEHAMEESRGKMQESMGSTCEGVGAALAEKIRRRGTVLVGDLSWNLLAQDSAAWKNASIVDTVRSLNSLSGVPVYVEGTQGYKLSMHTSGFYPFVTSRECGPEGILADIGLTPRSAKTAELVCVLRTHPIRVGGNSGDLPNETTWDQLKVESMGYISVPERTTVTNRVRRIGHWSYDGALQTVVETRPTHLAITFLDYLFPETAKATEQDGLQVACLRWLESVQRSLNTEISYVSTAAGQEHTFRVEVA